MYTDDETALIKMDYEFKRLLNTICRTKQRNRWNIQELKCILTQHKFPVNYHDALVARANDCGTLLVKKGSTEYEFSAAADFSEKEDEQNTEDIIKIESDSDESDSDESDSDESDSDESDSDESDSDESDSDQADSHQSDNSSTADHGHTANNAGDSSTAEHGNNANNAGGSSTGEHGNNANNAGGSSTGDHENNASVPVYCICRQPDDFRGMVKCPSCQEWFHERYDNALILDSKMRKTHFEKLQIILDVVLIYYGRSIRLYGSVQRHVMKRLVKIQVIMVMMMKMKTMVDKIQVMVMMMKALKRL